MQQLCGCKFLLHTLIEILLVCGTTEPGTVAPDALRELLAAWDKHRVSAEHRNAIEKSQPAKEGRSRLSQRIWQAQWEHTHGAQLGIRIANGILDFSSLSPRDQQLVQDDAAGRTAKRLRNVLDKHLLQQPPYRGAGVSVSLQGN